MDDYLIHFGVKGMKWGVRKEVYNASDRKQRKQFRKDFRANVKKETKRYRTNKGPEQDAFFMKNASNSAARSYFRSDRAKTLGSYRSNLKEANIKESRLSKDNVNNGRYRVARARQIKRNVLSSIGGLTLGGAAIAVTSAATAGAPLIAAGVATIGTLTLRQATGATYYKKEKNMYGKYRSQQTTSNKKPKS